MKEKSIQILQWGMKILAERYWDHAYKPDINSDILEKCGPFLPQSDDLIKQFDKGYFVPEDEPIYTLKSIFTCIDLFKDQTSSSSGYLEAAFDFNKLYLPQNQKVLDRSVFRKDDVDFNALNKSQDAGLLINHLQKYGSVLPILNAPDCAMPVAEYIKLAAALATQPQGDFRLVVGDFSGIQDFIYTISSERALKILRARSFYLELLLNNLAHEICNDLNLTAANILFAGGGNFLLLLPEVKELDNQLEAYYRSINQFFIQLFEGNLHLVIASQPLTHTDLKTVTGEAIQTKWNELFSKVLSKAKNQKFKGLLPDLAKIEEPYGHRCSICRADYRDIQIDEQTGYCPFCTMLDKIGTRLHQWPEIPVTGLADQRLAKPGADSANPWPFLAGKAKASHIFRFNEITGNKPLMFYCNYIATRQENSGETIPLSFEEMAKNCLGDQRIATLAMDVDNMSRVFREGLQVDDPRKYLIYTATLSRMLDTFFKPGLKWLCENPQYTVPSKTQLASQKPARNLSVIYSGGDDLLLAGGWDDVAEIAVDIARAFRKYTCGNPDLGISGALYLSNATFPFYISVTKAKEAESLYAKETPKDGVPRKNRMVFFYDELTSFKVRSMPDSSEREKERKSRYLLAATWKEVEDHIIPYLALFLHQNLLRIDSTKFDVKYSKSFLGKLHEMQQKYLSYPEGEIFIPDLVYHYSRIEKSLKKDLKIIHDTFLKYDEKSLNNPIRYLPVVLNWLELLLRDRE